MVHPKGRSEHFNRDLLDDGILRPHAAAAAPAPVTADEDAGARRKAALERLRAEIQIGLDQYEAGLFYEITSKEELYNLIMSDDDDVEADEAAQDRDPGKS